MSEPRGIEPLWIVLPGLPLAADDYADLAALLPGEVRVLDIYRVPVTAPSARLRAELGPLDRPATLIGHSMGGLAALDWLFEDPSNVDRVVLLDPSLPSDPVTTSLMPGRPAARLIRVIIGLVTRIPGVARALGRAGRAQLISLYKGQPDRLPQATIDRVFGTRAALLSTWDQLCERFVLQLRMRDAVAFSPVPVAQVISSQADAELIARQRELSEILGSTIIEVDEGHLFGCQSPGLVAGIIQVFASQTPQKDS